MIYSFAININSVITLKISLISYIIKLQFAVVISFQRMMTKPACILVRFLNIMTAIYWSNYEFCFFLAYTLQWSYSTFLSDFCCKSGLHFVLNDNLLTITATLLLPGQTLWSSCNTKLEPIQPKGESYSDTRQLLYSNSLVIHVALCWHLISYCI